MATIGVHTVHADGMDLSCLVDSVSINHGRNDTTSQPEASSCTIELTANEDYPLPRPVDVGNIVVVKTTTPGGVSTRFVGRITDLSLGWDDAGDDTPDAGVGQITAVGVLADLGRRVVGDTPWPQELDGARVANVMAAAQVPLDPFTSDPGTVDLLPRDVDARAALEVAHAAASSAMGVLWMTKGGEVRYADADHRRGAAVVLSLDSCDILVTPTWSRTTGGLVNKVSIGYGPTPEEGEQERYVASADTSVAKWGTFDYTNTTELAARADAEAMGNLLLTRNSQPVWVMTDLPVDVAGLDDARYEALLDLDMHSLIELTGLPSLGHAPTEAILWVEGWTETLTYGSHQIDLVVSGYCRTVPPPRWDDLSPDWTWGSQVITEARRNLLVNPALTIDESHWAAHKHGSYPGTPVGTRMAGGDGPPVAQGVAYFRTEWPVAYERSDGNGAKVGAPATDAIRVAHLPAGTSVMVSCWVRSTGAGPKRRVRVLIDTYGDTSNLIGSQTRGPDTDVAAGGWTLVPCSPRVLDAGATRMVVHLQMHDDGGSGAEPIVAGELLDVTAYMVEVGTEPLPYFDGDTPDTAAEVYDWTGARGASPSVQSVVTIDEGLPPDLVWDDLSCLGPPIDVGRWNDQPATLRWDQVDPVATWDTYAKGP